MSKGIKVRNIRNEYRYSFIWNLIITAAIMALAVVILPAAGPIGPKNMIALHIIEGGLMMFFMHLLEKYAITISGYYERALIAVLSSGFTLAIMCFVNLIFFMSVEKLILDAVMFVAKILGIMIIDFILLMILNNKKKFKKPKLLIIASEAKNFYRMKRIK